MSDRLFDIEQVPEVPLIRLPRRARGAQIEDERLDHDYPPEWDCCGTCGGRGTLAHLVAEARTPRGGWTKETLAELGISWPPPKGWRRELESRACPACLGMGSVKARVRLEAGHRCVRCGHPFMPKHDARMLGEEPSPGRWSPCDAGCEHGGPIRVLHDGEVYGIESPVTSVRSLLDRGDRVLAEWRVLTTHHLDGDKANLRWWNLVSLCQRCHLYIQHKVVMERVYPHEHSMWFKPFAAGYYAWVYLGEDLTRDETMARLDELLGLELVA